jgi:hypothetical protein
MWWHFDISMILRGGSDNLLPHDIDAHSRFIRPRRQRGTSWRKAHALAPPAEPRQR